METETITPQEIRDIRTKYHLSQQAFARLLGIGEASMVRYENGQVPTRANANLIRAAKKPSFMRDCLKSAGDLLSEAQREDTERIVYSMITFGEDGEVDTMTDIYLITLDQEILNEKAANILADINREIRIAKERGDEHLAEFLDVIAMDLARLKPTIATIENATHQNIAVLRGKIETLENLARTVVGKARYTELRGFLDKQNIQVACQQS